MTASTPNSNQSSRTVLDVTEATFDTVVLQGSRDLPVIVDFWAPWCGPCRTLGPMIEGLAREFQGQVVLAKVNTDDNPGLALRYDVRSIPTVIAFRDGRPVDEFMGALPEPVLRQFFDRLLPTEADRIGREAATVLATDPAAAVARYRQALERDDRNAAAQIGLARALIQAGQFAEAERWIEDLPAATAAEEEVGRLTAGLALHRACAEHGSLDQARRRAEAEPGSLEAQYALGCCLAAAGRYAEALERLVGVLERDRGFGQGAAHQAVLHIFTLLGSSSELADEYRSRLAMMLY